MFVWVFYICKLKYLEKKLFNYQHWGNREAMDRRRKENIILFLRKGWNCSGFIYYWIFFAKHSAKNIVLQKPFLFQNEPKIYFILAAIHLLSFIYNAVFGKIFT